MKNIWARKSFFHAVPARRALRMALSSVCCTVALAIVADPCRAAQLIVFIDDTVEGSPSSSYTGSTGWTLVSSIVDPSNPGAGFTDNLFLAGTTLDLGPGVTSVVGHANLIEKPPGQPGGVLGSGRFSDLVQITLSNAARGPAGVVMNLTFATDTNETGTTTAIGLQETGSPQLLLDTLSGHTPVNFFTGPNGLGFNFNPLELKVTVHSDLDPTPEPETLVLVAMSLATGTLLRRYTSRKE